MSNELEPPVGIVGVDDVDGLDGCLAARSDGDGVGVYGYAKRPSLGATFLPCEI